MEKRVLYIIPNKGVGGVERLHEYLNDTCEFANVEFLELSESKQSVLPYMFSLLRICRYLIKKRPTHIIGSLWRVHLAMVVLRIYLKFEYIPFYHSLKSRSCIDDRISRLAYNSSDRIIYDSDATSKRFNNLGKQVRVTSLFMPKSDYKRISGNPSKLSFVYVGRVAKVKNLEESLKFLNVYKELTGLEIRFDIYGPLEYNLSLDDYSFARFCGALAQEDVLSVILGYDVFLQTSEVEGFAMTAKESLRAGQFCVLTSVGDLANYQSDKMFLTYKSIQETARDLNELSLEEITQYQENAVQRFVDSDTLLTDFKKIIDEFTVSKL